jgi:chemotaxis protein CheZ
MSNDDQDLESLFDSIREQNTTAKRAEDSVPAKSLEGSAQSSMINQLGQITRNLHDTLRELGLNKQIEKVTSSIPDARDRLNYVATLTQQAAERVLNATEAVQPLVQNIEKDALHLESQLQKLFDGELSTEEFKALMLKNKTFIQQLPIQAKKANGYVMEIMMAQDFQDLTGQVIKKIIDLTQNMEKQLLALLLENVPVEARSEVEAGLLGGPVIKPGQDVVTSQDEVDALLGSMGF